MNKDKLFKIRKKNHFFTFGFFWPIAGAFVTALLPCLFVMATCPRLSVNPQGWFAYTIAMPFAGLLWGCICAYVFIGKYDYFKKLISRIYEKDYRKYKNVLK